MANKNVNNKPNVIALVLVALIMALILPSLSAQSSMPGEIPSALPKGALNASLYPSAVVCTENPCQREFNLTVVNKERTDVALGFYEKRGDNWAIIGDVGNVSASSTDMFTFPFRLMYNGLTTYIGKYALISDTYKIKEFTIAESWETYESKAREIISLGGFVIAPVIALALILVITIAVRSAERRRYGFNSDYTDTTLFKFPEGGSFGQQMAVVLTNPITWVVVTFFAMLLLFMLAYSAYPDYPIWTKIQIVMISLVAAAVLPVILMLLTWYADTNDRGPLRFVVGMFMWGVLAAFIAFFLNGAVLFLFNKSLGLLPLVLISAFGSVIVSPIVEEVLKAFGLGLMSQHRKFDDALDGLLYGFAIGLGFAMMENWFYFIARIDPILTGVDTWLSVILYRSLFNTIAHGCFTAFIGVMLGALKSRPLFKPYYHIVLFPGIFIAILLHVAFNFTAYLDVVSVANYQTVLVSFNPALVGVVAIVFVVLYAFATYDTRRQRGLGHL